MSETDTSAKSNWQVIRGLVWPRTAEVGSAFLTTLNSQEKNRITCSNWRILFASFLTRQFYFFWPCPLTFFRLSVWISTFIAGWFSLSLLQSKKSDAYVDYVPNPDAVEGNSLRPVRFAGRTMDLTLFAVCRALDVVVGELWAIRKTRRIRQGKWTKVRGFLVPAKSPSLYIRPLADGDMIMTLLT